MLTGDKLETATCTAKNAHLVTRTQDIHIFRLVSDTHRPWLKGPRLWDRRAVRSQLFSSRVFLFFCPSFLPQVFVSVTAALTQCAAHPGCVTFVPSGALCCFLTPVEHTLLSSILLQVTNRGEAHLELNAFRRKHDCALVISGDSLEVLMPQILAYTFSRFCTA